MVKKSLLLLLLFSSATASSFADGLFTLDVGHENYIDISTSESDATGGAKDNGMVQSVYAGFSASYIRRNFLGGLYVSSVFALTSPNFMLCEPGLELGFMVWYPDLFYTVMVHGAPVFHDENYIEPGIDFVMGANIRTYSKILDKNLFFVFGFGIDYYTSAGNMAYKITIGLAREAYFERSRPAAPASNGAVSRRSPEVTIEAPADSSIDITLPE